MIELCESAQKINVSNFSVKILIFEADNKTDLLGLDLNGWLNVATINFNKQFISSNNNHEEQIIKNLDNSDITVVLHAFNPLITENNINSNTYIVVKGDNLYQIAKKYNVTVDELKKQNNLASNILSIGQKLTIPNQKEEYTIYTVVKGDTLYQIAKQNNTTIDELKKQNNLTSNLLSIGQKLKIPR